MQPRPFSSGFFCVVLALLSTMPGAVAQQLNVGQLQVDSNGACKRDELAHLPELGPDRLVKGRGFTYITAAEPRVRRLANPNAAAIFVQPALFAPAIIYGVD